MCSGASADPNLMGLPSIHDAERREKVLAAVREERARKKAEAASNTSETNTLASRSSNSSDSTHEFSEKAPIASVNDEMKPRKSFGDKLRNLKKCLA